ncbi:hypothetical protein ACIQCJ_21470 [Streptomyces sp. NPDC093221]|uniref:hypothetical protein n=1 Tax=Streptomyces sp. NPDC093221 TaxID=3366032 RepID=UPI003827924A
MSAPLPERGVADLGRTLSLEARIAVRGVTLIMVAVVALAFLFGFGNVWLLALRLGVPAWVAPLVAPAVDLSVVGLLVGTRYLVLHGGRPEQLRPARQLLVFSSVMTLALNVADPLIAGLWGEGGLRRGGPAAAHRLGGGGPRPAPGGDRRDFAPH